MPLYLDTRRPRGFALIMVLIFLLLITMLAVGTAQHALLQQRMAGSLRNAEQARMSAETALRGAEYEIWSRAGQGAVSLHCQDGAISANDGCIVYNPRSDAYGVNGTVTRFQTAPGWLQGVGKSYTGPLRRGYTRDKGQPTAVLAENPAYIIEDLGSMRPPGAGGLHESGNTGPNNGGQGEVDIHIYRVTARATGGNPHVVRILQSTFDAPASP